MFRARCRSIFRVVFPLALLAAIGAIWVRSYFVGDQFEWLRNYPDQAVQRVFSLSAGRGGIAFTSILLTDGTDPPAGIMHYELKPPPYAGLDADRSAWRRPFSLSHESTDPLEDDWEFSLPLWSLASIPAAWLMLRIIPAIRRRGMRRRGFETIMPSEACRNSPLPFD